MSLTPAIHESLPYIDAEPTPAQRTSAQSLIEAELALSPSSPSDHPSLPPLPQTTTTPLHAAELARIEAKTPLSAIDLSAYEELSLPAVPEPQSRKAQASQLEQYRSTLAKAYTASTYLSSRATNLALLDEFGKNAWLVGNMQLEGLLVGVEKELSERKEEIDRVVVERKNAQEAVGGEVQGLEEGWRRGVVRVLEVEVAGEGLRREILTRRREGAK